jgi:mannose-6-phosphate isomerase-like protein (cupin superfamily)
MRSDFPEAEIASLQTLRRGVFAKKAIRAGQRITLGDVFLAIPLVDEQLTANEMSKYTEFYAEKDIPEKGAVLYSDIRRREIRERVGGIVKRVKAFLLESNVPVPPKVDLELSHHYGIESFDEYGLTLITIVNRAYCKKLIILLPGQKHPEQYHNQKEETFHVLYGNVWLTLDGVERLCRTGEVITIERGVHHSFRSDRGVVVEEISSTHIVEDSFYTDPAIMSNPYRKTLLTHWMD